MDNKEVTLFHKEELQNELAKVLSNRGYAHLNDKAVQEAFEYACAVRQELKEARRIMQRAMNEDKK